MSELLSQAPATIALLILTVAVSLLAFANENVWRYLALEPHHMAVTHQYHPIVTAGFVHADIVHLFLNMYVLFIFGPILEVTVGARTFLAIYLLSLVVGNLYPYLKFRRQINYIAIGASGAISGILFSFCLFYPTETLYVFFVPMPAVVFAVLYLAYSIYSMRHRNDNIGHEAHLAGAVGGIISTIILVPDVIDHILGFFR
jgi:membrane associated rhomboid family serine protease